MTARTSQAPARDDGTPAQRHARLVAEIRRHDELYYVHDAPVISDAEYDALYAELQRLEQQHPELVTPDSPTQRVPGAALSVLAAVEHRLPMLSLANTYSREEVEEWFASVGEFLGGPAELRFSIEPKLDGVAVELVYEGGELVRAITRGDGRIGDDVTHTVRTIHGLPLRLGTPAPPPLLEVRGEVVMTHAAFRRVNEARLAAGEEPFVNPRNLASGTLKLLDPALAARRPLRFVAYGLGATEGFPVAGHRQAMETLAGWGVPTAGELATAGDLEHVLAFHDDLLARRDELRFDVDGSVIKVDDVALQARLGQRSRSPRWAIAYKFPARQATSIVRRIVVSVGRTGALTPKAVIDPVHVGGVTVENVTLHNRDEIERLGVKVGDRVLVERAGDVIPKIVAVTEHGEGEPFVMPDACPACGTPVEEVPGEVVVRCPNRACPGVLRRRIEHFVSRGAMDVDGVGEKLVEQLVERGLVRRLSDLYALTPEQLAALPRQGETSARNVVQALHESRTRPFARLLYGLGIRHVGEHVAAVVAARWPGVEALRGASREALEDVAEIGPVVAESLSEWLADADEQADLDRMLERGVAPAAEPAAARQGPLAGRTFLVTGTLSSMSRREATALIKSLGGRLLSGVSGGLDVLVVGDKPGSKLKKARELGTVEILEEPAFLALVGRESQERPAETS